MTLSRKIKRNERLPKPVWTTYQSCLKKKIKKKINPRANLLAPVIRAAPKSVSLYQLLLAWAEEGWEAALPNQTTVLFIPHGSKTCLNTAGYKFPGDFYESFFNYE